MLLYLQHDIRWYYNIFQTLERSNKLFWYAYVQEHETLNLKYLEPSSSIQKLNGILLKMEQLSQKFLFRAVNLGSVKCQSVRLSNSMVFYSNHFNNISKISLVPPKFTFVTAYTLYSKTDCNLSWRPGDTVTTKYLSYNIFHFIGTIWLGSHPTEHISPG